jgi:hypothetical protein
MVFSDNKNKLIHTSETIKRQNAQFMCAEVQLGLGKLYLSGGAKQLMEADFKYNTEKLRPSVDYQEEGKKGRLLVSQPSTSQLRIMKYRYEWDIRLNNDVPLELGVESGAANSELQLNGLNLKKLDVDMGLGEMKIDLSGSWKQGFKVEMNGGVGRTKLILPKEAGVKVNLNKGLGKVRADRLFIVGNQYFNQAYESSDVKIEIECNLGVGSLDLMLEE